MSRSQHGVEVDVIDKINEVRPACPEKRTPRRTPESAPPREQNSKVIGEVCDVVDPGKVELVSALSSSRSDGLALYHPESPPPQVSLTR